MVRPRKLDGRKAVNAHSCPIISPLVFSLHLFPSSLGLAHGKPLHEHAMQVIA